MARVTVCLLFLAIFQIGILKSSAEESTTEGELKRNEETTAKPTEGEPAKEPPSKSETEDKSKVTTKTEPKDDKEKAVKNNDSKKDSPITQITGGDPTKLLPDIVKGVQGGAENNQTKVLFDVPKTLLAPVNAVGAKIKEVVEKGFDTAKDFASGTFNFFKNAINSPFENNQ